MKLIRICSLLQFVLLTSLKLVLAEGQGINLGQFNFEGRGRGKGIAHHLEEQVLFNVYNHQPCNEVKKPHEKIRFSSIDEAPVIADPKQRGCYIIKGSVTIDEDIDGDLELYVDLRTTAGHHPQQVPCKPVTQLSQDSDNLIGSCPYSQPCQVAAEHSQISSTARVSLTKEGGQPLKCGEKWTAGTHEDIELRFCTLSKAAFLGLQDYDSDLWDVLARTAEEENGPAEAKVPIFMRLYIFDHNVKRIFFTQKRLEDNYRATHPGEDVPEGVLRRLPFNKFMSTTDSYLSCHMVAGEVIMDIGKEVSGLLDKLERATAT